MAIARHAWRDSDAVHQYLQNTCVKRYLCIVITGNHSLQGTPIWLPIVESGTLCEVTSGGTCNTAADCYPHLIGGSFYWSNDGVTPTTQACLFLLYKNIRSSLKITAINVPSTYSDLKLCSAGSSCFRLTSNDYFRDIGCTSSYKAICKVYGMLSP